MIMAYLSYKRAALYSELIAPRYFLAIPFTIMTYIVKSMFNFYLPFFPIFRYSSELASTGASSLKIQ